MKRIAILCWILLLSMQGITAAGKLPFPLPEAKTGGVDTDISYTSGDMTYVFGSDGEGLIKVEKNGVEIYDFGRRPAWFLLKYMLQEKISGIVKTRPMYYYPQVGSDNPDKNYLGAPIRDPGTLPEFPDFLPPGMLYIYQFTEPEHCNTEEDKTTVGLYFVIPNPPTEPFDGIMIYITVVNYAGERGDQKYRLMEVHCPFVRLPMIGESKVDDVTTIGNYLLDNPIETYKPKIEPYEVTYDQYGMPNSNYLIQDTNYYPCGFQVRAYYEKTEPSGKGIYMAIYNTSREVCQNNLYKHQGGYSQPQMPSWSEWIGSDANHPDLDHREYLLWDVVRYTSDINQNEDLNSYAVDLYSTGESWAFCTFMKFYDKDLDWHIAAEKYRSTYEFLDDANLRGNLPENHPVNLMTIVTDLWPDHAAKYNSRIPDWAKYQPFYLYVSPQHPNSRHTMSPDLLNRFREWQVQLRDELEVYPGQNYLLASTWIPRYAQDPNHMELYHNYPEWAGGWIPFDNNLSDGTGQLSYTQKFYRTGLTAWLDSLRLPSPSRPSQVKFISAVHGYLYAKSKLIDSDKYDDLMNKLDNDYFHTSWPYNTALRPERITGHFTGFGNDPSNENNYLWGGETWYWTNDPVPRRKQGVWGLNRASRYGMDYSIGQLVPPVPGEEERDLEFGFMDAQYHPDCLNADGAYLAEGGSSPFMPIYEGFQNLLSSPQPPTNRVIHYDTGQPIPPGGGVQEYYADLDILEHLDTTYPDKIGVNEGLGECYLSLYDIVMADGWPSGSFAETQQQGMAKFATSLNIESNLQDGPLPLKWIPMMETISHDLVLFQAGPNAFAPGLFWHTYLPLDPFRWTYYGGSPWVNNDQYREQAWLAYNADIANAYANGAKLCMFDVDAGLYEDGSLINLPTFNDTTNFWSDKNSDYQGTRTFLKKCLQSYKQFGFPKKRDKVTEHLFFGRLLRTPDIGSYLPPSAFRNLKYDLSSGMQGDGVNTNIELPSPVILHSLWKSNLASNSTDPENPRLGFVFCNFSETGYTLQTKSVNLMNLFESQEQTYSWYYYSSTAVTLNPISDPTKFVAKATVNARSTVIVGVAKTGIQPPLGPYSPINQDENLDLLQLEDGVLSVVFGDGTMDYDTADAVTVLTGVTDFSLGKISSQDTVDIVCITKTGIEVLSCDQTGSFDTILSSEGLFSDAVKIAQILETEAKYIVQDGSSLKQLSITSASGGNDNELFDILTDEILCEPVRTFSIENLCSDDTMDMVTITEDGSVELLNWSADTPESMVVIEIGTGADGIAFDDTDNDSDLDIILENSAKNSGPDVLTYVGDWKFTPED